MIPPNTAVHGSVMRGVLEHLATMSARIVDDTRHEKVLAYMRLFLGSAAALEQLQAWDALGTLEKCLASPDARVTSVAARFLADAVAHADGLAMWTRLFNGHPAAVQWVVRAGDSPEALERLAGVYFLRRAAEHYRHDAYLKALLAQADVGRLVVRRTLDASHYVAHEAARLLAALCWRGGRVDDAWVRVAAGMREPLARLGVARVLLMHAHEEVRRRAAAEFALGDGVFDGDRLVRDRALDVLEASVAVTGQVDAALDVLRSGGGGSGRDVLRALASVVRGAPTHARCREIAGLCAGALAGAVGSEAVAFEAAPDVHVAGRMLGVHVARVLDALGQHAWDAPVARALAAVLADGRVLRGHAHQPLLRAVLTAAGGMLRRSAEAGDDCGLLLAVAALVGDFGVHAGALRIVLDAVGRAVVRGADAGLVAVVVEGVGRRMADVEWEGRDLAVEFVATCVGSGGWHRAQALVLPLVGDLVGALEDPDEHVRASSACALAAVRDAQRAAGHPAVCVDPAVLSRLLCDPEAVVRRAAAELLCALLHGSPPDLTCMQAVDGALLRRLARDEDFEVRVRCARVLAALVWLAYFPQTMEVVAEEDAAADGAGLVAEDAGALLVEMCGDSSRYVRRVCFDSLVSMREADGGLDQKEEEEEEAVGAQGKRLRTRVVGDAKGAFGRRLRNVDYVALERSLHLEHLYHEALDAPVERDLMDEDDEANCGNNILECY